MTMATSIFGDNLGEEHQGQGCPEIALQHCIGVLAKLKEPNVYKPDNHTVPMFTSLTITLYYCLQA